LFYNNRGTIYDDLGQHQRAIEDYNDAIRLKQDYTDAYFKQGDYLWQRPRPVSTRH